MNEEPREARPGERWTPVAAATPAAEPALLRSLAVLTRVAAALVVVLGATALVGWATGVWWLKDPIRGFVFMMPNTALMLIMAGLSLGLSASAPRRRVRAARALAVACGALALASVAENVSGRDLGIDTLLFDAARPAAPTSIALVSSSAALLALDARPRRGPRPAELLAVATATFAAFTLGGYLFGAIQFYVPRQHPLTIGMAINTAAALLLLAIGILAARPSSGAMATVTSPLVGGQVVRRMLLVALAIPFLGYWAVRAQQAGLYDPPGAAVVTSVAGMIVASLITIAIGGSLNRTDARRRRTEEEAREWKRFVDRAGVGAVFGTIGGELGRINEAFARMHGYTVAELEGTPIAGVFPPHRRAELAENIRVTHERGHCRWESEHLRRDGSVFPVVIDLSAIYDDQGKLLYRAAYVQDITEEKEAEAARAEERSRTNAELRASLREKDVLIKEVHHRVKNNLQVIASLLNLQASHVADAASREVLRESQSRVRSIALAHEAIHRSSDVGSVDLDAYLASLVHSLVLMYDAPARGVSIVSRGVGVRLGIDAAMHCGLIVNELVSNAVKHAFPGGRRGTVEAALRREDEALVLGVADDGIGFPAELDYRSSPSLGLSLVCTLTKQLGGSITMTRGAGTAFAVRFASPEPPARA
jgi:PAS domain S-box-containing protein